MRLTVVGTGYVGMVTGASMAHLGHEVSCLDVDCAKIRQLQQGRIPIYEPGLDELITGQMRAGRLRFVSDYAEAVPLAEAIFICVGTPSLPTGQTDTSALAAAARGIGENLGSDYCVIINKSTVLSRQRRVCRDAGPVERRTASGGCRQRRLPARAGTGDGKRARRDGAPFSPEVRCGLEPGVLAGRVGDR